MEKALEVVPSATAFVDYFLDISGILESRQRTEKQKRRGKIVALLTKTHPSSQTRASPTKTFTFSQLECKHTITVQATVKIGFVNQVSGEAIKYTTVRRDGSFFKQAV